MYNVHSHIDIEMSASDYMSNQRQKKKIISSLTHARFGYEKKDRLKFAEFEFARHVVAGQDAISMTIFWFSAMCRTNKQVDYVSGSAFARTLAPFCLVYSRTFFSMDACRDFTH